MAKRIKKSIEVGDTQEPKVTKTVKLTTAARKATKATKTTKVAKPKRERRPVLEQPRRVVYFSSKHAAVVARLDSYLADNKTHLNDTVVKALDAYLPKA